MNPLAAGGGSSFDLTPANSYAVGTARRAALESALAEIRSTSHDIPTVVGGRVVRTGQTFDLEVPHDHRAHLGLVHQASAPDVEAAITPVPEDLRGPR